MILVHWHANIYRRINSTVNSCETSERPNHNRTDKASILFPIIFPEEWLYLYLS